MAPLDFPYERVRPLLLMLMEQYRWYLYSRYFKIYFH